MPRFPILRSSAPNSIRPLDVNVNDPPPARRQPGGVGGAVRSALRPGGVLTQPHPLATRIETPVQPPMPTVTVPTRRNPRPGARPPSKAIAQMKDTTDRLEKMTARLPVRPAHAHVNAHPVAGAADAPAGSAAATAPALSQPGDRAAVQQALTGLLAASPQRDTAVLRWLALAGADDAQRARLMAHAVPVVSACAGEAARLVAVMDALAAGRASSSLPLQTRCDVHAVQQVLAATGFGMKTLMELMGRAPAGPQISKTQYQFRDAVKVEIRAGAALAALMTCDTQAFIQSGDDVAALVQVALGQADADHPDASLPWNTHLLQHFLPRVDQQTLACAAQPLALAIQCARSLQVDLESTPPLAQRIAYFDFRNGLLDMRAPAVSALRSDERRLPAAAQIKQLFYEGFMHAVQGQGLLSRGVDLGSVASRLRNIEQDFEHVAAATDQWIRALNLQLQQHRGEAGASAAVLRKAIRVATVAEYKRKVSQKGWRESVKLSRKGKRRIAQQAARALGLEVTEVRRRDKTIGALPVTADLLRQWAQDEGLDLGDASPGQLDAKLVQLKRLAHWRDPQNVPGTAEDRVPLVRSLIAESRHTFPVSFGGMVNRGLHFNAGVAVALERKIEKYALGLIPFAVPYPDIRRVNGSGEAFEIGSTGGGAGYMAFGRKTSRELQLGAGVYASWPFARGFLRASVGGSAIVFAQDKTKLDMAVLRTRLFPVGNPPPRADGMEHWRACLLALYDAMTGPPGRLPTNATLLWERLASRAYKDPDVSFGFTPQEERTRRSAILPSGSLRAGLLQLKLGLAGAVGANRVWSERVEREDLNGALQLRHIGKSSLTEGTVRGRIELSVRPLGPLLTAAALQSPPIPLAAAGTSIGNTYKGNTKRICEDDDGMVADATLTDQEFGSHKEHLRYVDSKDAQWAWSASNPREPGATPSRAPLDTYNTQVKNDARDGNKRFIERLSMRKPAAQAWSQLEEMRKRLPPPGRSAAADAYRRTAIAAALAPLGHGWEHRAFGDEAQAKSFVLNQPESWRPRCLYAADDVHIVVRKGLDRDTSPLVVAEWVGEARHLHMTHTIAARPDDPPAPGQPGAHFHAAG